MPADSPVEEARVERAVAELQYRSTWHRDPFERKYGRHTLDLMLYYNFAYVIPLGTGHVALEELYSAPGQWQLKFAEQHGEAALRRELERRRSGRRRMDRWINRRRVKEADDAD